MPAPQRSWVNIGLGRAVYSIPEALFLASFNDVVMDTTIFEFWQTMMRQAAQHPEWWQQTTKAMPEGMMPKPEWVQQWMAAGASALSPEAEQHLEDWYRMMGVVPRQRYLELLEKYDALNRKWEAAEATLRKLQENKAKDVAEETSQNLMETLKAAADSTMAMQSFWLSQLMGKPASESSEEQPPSEKPHP